MTSRTVLATHAPRKRFGQHFLTDGGVVAAIVAAIRPRAGERIVEIGPGLGAMTDVLLAAVPSIVAIEIDRDLARAMRTRHASGRLELIEADVLAVDFAALAGGEPLRVVGNLPYNISTPLLFHLDAFAASIVDMHFMLQKEVVDRMAAQAGDDAYGRLSVMLQAGWHVVPLFDVAPEAFDPPPRVQSAVVRLVPHPAMRSRIGDRALFARIVADGFAQRRKMLRNAMARWYALDPPRLATIIEPTQRAEQVALEAWIAFANTVHALQGTRAATAATATSKPRTRR